MKAPHEGAPIDINQPSSYLAISELVVRAVDGKLFTEDSVNWNKLTSNLPQTAPVSENANAVVIQYQGKPYVRLNGGDWVLPAVNRKRPQGFPCGLVRAHVAITADRRSKRVTSCHVAS